MLEFSYHHVGVSVPNLDDALRWYGDVLGFELEYQRTLESTPCRMAMLKNGPLRVELFEMPGARPAADVRSSPDQDLLTYGNKHVSFIVKDVPAFAEELRRRRADIVWVKQSRPNFQANIFIRDHAGNLIEFVEGPMPAPQPALL